MKKKTGKLLTSLMPYLAKCLMAYAVVISIAPCRGEWYQPKTPEALRR